MAAETRVQSEVVYLGYLADDDGGLDSQERFASVLVPNKVTVFLQTSMGKARLCLVDTLSINRGDNTNDTRLPPHHPRHPPRPPHRHRRCPRWY